MLRSTWHVFDLYVNHLGDTVIDLWAQGDMPQITVPHKLGGQRTMDAIDLLATTFTDREDIAVVAVNKDAENNHVLHIPLDKPASITLLTLNGESKDAYNDVDHEGVKVTEKQLGLCSDTLEIDLPAHSVNIILIR